MNIFLVMTLAGSNLLCKSFSENENDFIFYNPKYDYNGKIGEDWIHFYEERFGTRNILQVSKSDKSIIYYVDDLNDDFKLEYVEILKDGETHRYMNNEIGREVLKKAQKQFENYLEKIIKIKKEEGIEKLKE